MRAEGLAEPTTDRAAVSVRLSLFPSAQADSMYAGVGTHFIPLASLPSFISDMESSASPLESLLSRYSTALPADKPDAKLKSFLPARRALIDRVFAADSYDGVLRGLEQAAKDSKDEEEGKWIAGVQKQLSTKSPTSLMVRQREQRRGAAPGWPSAVSSLVATRSHACSICHLCPLSSPRPQITFHLMQLGGRAGSLAECLATELRLGARITAERGGGDFQEGVKAIVVDKKHKPVWQPMPTLQQIKDKYFAPFRPEEGIDELKL